MLESLEHVAVAALALTAERLPRRRGLAIGRALGRRAWAVGVRRQVSLDNLERALGAQLDVTQRRGVARQAYEHLGMLVVELLQMARMSRQARSALVEFSGRQHLERALSQGRGAIVASAHYGNWELLGAGGVAHDLPVTFVVQRLRNPKVDALLQQRRLGLGVRCLGRGMALRRVREEIAANRLVAIMCDQDARRRGVFVPFFGTLASSHKGAAQLAIRLQTPFIPLFGRRLPDGTHRMLVHEPIEVSAKLNEDDAVRDMLAHFNQRLENVIRDDPTQYLWMHRRWKTAPPGSSPEASTATRPFGGSSETLSRRSTAPG